MKIETNKIDNRITFERIETGQAFYYKGVYYIKTEPVRMSSVREKYANAVRLIDGDSGYCFHKYDPVTKLNAKVVIEDVPDDTDYCNNDCEHCEWVTCPKETFRKVFEADDDVEVIIRVQNDVNQV